MKKFVVLASVAAFALSSGVAGAATLTNQDKANATVVVHVKGAPKLSVTLKHGDSFNSKGKPVYFVMGKQKSATVTGEQALIIQGGKIIPDVKKADAAPAAATPAKVTAKAVTPVATVKQ